METYRIKYLGYVVGVTKQDDGTAAVHLNGHRAVTHDWEPASLLTAADTVIGAYEAQRKAQAEREQAVMEAQQLSHSRAKAKAALDAAAV